MNSRWVNSSLAFELMLRSRVYYDKMLWLVHLL